MNTQLTELVFILDRSGSMHGLEKDTLGGFNSMMEKQKKGEGNALVTTVLFDTEIDVIHDRLPLKSVRPMTEEDYVAGGCTALLDAVGSTIHRIGTVHKYARPEDVPAHTLVVIITDGEENSSRFYDYEDVRHMVEREKSKYGLDKEKKVKTQKCKILFIMNIYSAQKKKILIIFSSINNIIYYFIQKIIKVHT